MTTISHYEILEKLGEGGMGVVWKARDTRLQRFVALKVLPASRTADPGRRQRFAQEARAASALSHPHIVTIYDIDREDATDFIAMEYLAGKTLDRMIPAKGMRVAEALRYAIQIADALAAAHAAGIVHRDVKPGNIIVSDKGVVKVLDFGLAKLMEPVPVAESEYTQTMAADRPRTEEGTILGTASYMSPEQAQGCNVDARSDIFSFGTLLYEMLTGRRAFPGDSKMSTLAAIINLEPEQLEKHVEGVPRELTRIVQRCLRKHPDRRAHSMQDLKLALEELKEDSDSGVAPHPVAVSQPRRYGLYVVTALAAIVAVGGAAFWLARAGVRSKPASQVVPLTTYPGFETAPAFSPDGNQVAFSWNGGKGTGYDLYLKLIGPGAPLRLTTEAGTRAAVWSPDGRSLAFTRTDAGGMKAIVVIPALGGAEREVVNLGGQYGFVGGWSADGRWLLCFLKESQQPFGAFLVSVDTGQKRRLTSAPQGSLGDVLGSLSPDGRSLVFVRSQPLATTVSDVYLLSLSSDLTPKGEPRRLTSDNKTVFGIAWTGDAQVVFSSSRGGSTALWRMDPFSSEQPQRLSVGDGAVTLAISPRTNRLIYEHRVYPDSNIWRLDLTDPKAAPVPLIESTRMDFDPVYSPDGKKIAFSSDRSDSLEVWTCDAQGSNASQLTTRGRSGTPAWSPDGSQIAFDSIHNGEWQIFVVGAHGGQPRQLSFVGGTRPSWSHDGTWVYFAGNNAGSSGLWRIPASGGNAVRLTSHPGTSPVESEDGASIYYSAGTKIMRISADGADEKTVIDDVRYEQARNFKLTHEGIYYRPAQAPGEVRLFSLTGGPSRLILRSDRPSAQGLSVSPDGHWLLFGTVEREAGADLMLVEDFR